MTFVSRITIVCFVLGLLSCKQNTPFQQEKPLPPVGSFVFGGEGREVGYGLLELGNGDWVFVGSTIEPRKAGLSKRPDHDLQIIRTNSTGEELWTRTYQNEYFDETGHHIIQLKGGGFLAAGFRIDPLDGEKHWITLYQFDNGFDLISQKEYEFSPFIHEDFNYIHFNGIFELENDGYLLAFNIRGSNHTLVTDHGLNEVFRKTYGSNGQNPKNGFITPIGGDFLLTYVADYLLLWEGLAYVRLNGNGEEISSGWVFTGGSGYYRETITSTPEKEVKLIIEDLPAFYLYTLDSLGNYIGRKEIVGLNFHPGRIIPLGNGEFALIGDQRSYINGAWSDLDIQVAIIDDNGNLQSTFLFGLNGEDHWQDVILTSANKLVIVGATTSYGKGESDVYIIHQQL